MSCVRCFITFGIALVLATAMPGAGAALTATAEPSASQTAEKPEEKPKLVKRKTGTEEADAEPDCE